LKVARRFIAGLRDREDGVPAGRLNIFSPVIGVPDFQHNFNAVAQVTHEDDQAYGIPGLHEIRPKVKLLQNDYLSILGPDAVRFVQSNYAWYFSLFGYQTNPV
jgi:hypothetical protein